MINQWLKEKHGSRRGALRTYWHKVLFFLGRYNSYRQIDWSTINRLVFVCKGNICRSAYSEVFAKSLGINAISCGIDTDKGNSANTVAIEVGALRGVDLGQHKTTPIKSLELKETDLLLVMEPWQAEYVFEHYNGFCAFSLLGLWGKPVTPYIHDPYGMPVMYFTNCFNYLENSIHEIAKKISKS